MQSDMSPIGVMVTQVNYVNRQRVKDDAKRVTDAYKSLTAKIAVYVNNLGVESKLLAIAGTIPIKFAGVTYNIPVEMFLTERYPNEAPKLFVRPTSNMTVKANHRHVDMQGVVYLPYLHEWRAESNLVGLVEIASAIFSIEPPLYSKPASPAPAATSPAVAASATSSGYGTYSAVAVPSSSSSGVVSAVAVPSSSANNSTFARGTVIYPGAASTTTGSSSHNNNLNNNLNSNINVAAVTATGYSAVPAPTSTSSMGTYSSAAAKEQHQTLLEKVNLKLHSKLYDLHQQLNAELNKEFDNDRYLEQSEAKAKQHIAHMQAYIQDMQDAMAEIADKKVALEQFEAEQETKAKPAAEDYLQPYDALSTQITKLHAELNAIDDAFYFLERALVQSQNKSVDLTSFLRESRVLARQQFMCKAHLGKIQAHCMQAQHQFQQQQQHVAAGGR